jgi:hypothetical protein
LSGDKKKKKLFPVDQKFEDEFCYFFGSDLAPIDTNANEPGFNLIADKNFLTFKTFSVKFDHKF